MTPIKKYFKKRRKYRMAESEYDFTYMKDSFLFLYLTFKRNRKTNLIVLFSKGFTE